MRKAPLLYRALLRLLPPAFRREYGPELESVMLEQLDSAESPAGRIGCWGVAVVDIASSGAAEWRNVIADFRRQESNAAHLRLRGEWSEDAAYAAASAAHSRFPRKNNRMEGMKKDLAHAARALQRSPAFSLTAIATIALGIGATTSIFSVLNAVLLRPLPYTDAERLVFIQSDLTARNVNDFPLPPGDLPDLREQGTLFESIETVTTNKIPFADDGSDPEVIVLAQVTPGLLDLLGARVVAGRSFVAEDGTPLPQAAQPAAGAQAAPGTQPPPPPPVKGMISQGFWERRYGSDPDVVGRTLPLGNGRVEIVGVVGSELELLFPSQVKVERRPDLFIVPPIDFATASRINVSMRPMARLKPGVTVAQAQSQIDGIVNDLRSRFPIKETAGLRFRVEPMHDYLIAGVKEGIWAIMGAVVFVLLISCANVANLLLVRAAHRNRDMVVRAAMGATRGELMRRLLAESLLIALLGGAAGVGLALLGLELLVNIAPAELPRIDQVGLDPVVLSFTLVAALLSAVVFGLIPALRASRADAGAVLRAASRNTTIVGGRWIRNTVVVGEVALSFVLLVGSGLMIRSFVALQNTDPGFDPSNVLTFVVQPNGLRTPADRQAFGAELATRFAALPGVAGVTAAAPLPLDGASQNARWGTAEAEADPSLFQQADIHSVRPGYFDVMRTRIVEGRDFTSADDAPESTNIVIDRLLAEKAFPGKSAVGERLLVRVRTNEPEWLTVIGVVEHERHASLSAEGPEAIFVTDGFFGFGAASTWVLRTSGDPMTAADGVRAIVKEVTPLTPIGSMQPMQALVDKAMAPTRFALTLIGIFGAVAAVLASIGLYGVLSTAVRQGAAEIGVRVTLGASPWGIGRLVLGQGILLTGLGLIVGVGAALGLTRVLESQLIGVSATDPLTFAGIGLFFVAVATAACAIPALRAATVDPNVVLKE